MDVIIKCLRIVLHLYGINIHFFDLKNIKINIAMYDIRVANAAPTKPQYLINIKLRQIFSKAPMPLKTGDQFCFSNKYIDGIRIIKPA